MKNCIKDSNNYCFEGLGGFTLGKIKGNTKEDRYLVKLVFPIDREIRNFICGSGMKIIEHIDEETLVIVVDDYSMIDLRRVIYFKEIFELNN